MDTISGIKTFYELLNNSVEIEEKEKISKIVIPAIQRDYAQGRKDSNDINRIRNNFLNSLYESVKTNNVLNLDFIYGDIDTKGNLIPLDGQQRLTTLFLLHWYAAKKENISYEEYSFLSNFSYETRYSSRDFCSHLINFNPSFLNGKKTISDQIIDESWFPLDWANDQTIASMLVMIDDIAKKFNDVDSLWQKLIEGKIITFHFMSIDDFGFSDELYIKMNSRGKPLTRFEHFKAELESQISHYNKDIAKRISSKIDDVWTDMLWNYRDIDQIDNLFLNLFKFVCDVICYDEDNSTYNRSYDEFDLIDLYFNKEKRGNIEHNILLLESIYDAYASYKGNTLKELFEKFLSRTHTEGKTKVYNLTELDLFRDCLYSYMDINSSRRSRSFPLSKFLLFYAFTVYAVNKEKISEVDFIGRIRVVYNLIQNSDSEISSDSETRDGGNRIPASLKQIKSIVKEGKILDLEELIPMIRVAYSFNTEQIIEEKKKQEWRKLNPKYIPLLEEVEDCKYVRGQMSFLNFDCPENFSKFLDLFNCDLDKINCSLLVYGDYSRKENSFRYCFGTRAKDYSATVWRSILHKSRASGFENLKNIINTFLQENSNINNALLDKIVKQYLDNCESKSYYDWRYYFIKYPSFRPERYGKYWFESKYNFYVLYTEKKVSDNAYQPFLYEVCKTKLDREGNGKRCISGDNYLYCEDKGYFLKDEAGNVKASLLIDQDKNGIDREDRILKYKKNPII